MKTEPNVAKKMLSYREELILEQSDFLNKKEVALILRVSVSTISRLVRSGKLKKVATSTTSKCLFIKKDVMALLGL